MGSPVATRCGIKIPQDFGEPSKDIGPRAMPKADYQSLAISYSGNVPLVGDRKPDFPLGGHSLFEACKARHHRRTGQQRLARSIWIRQGQRDVGERPGQTSAEKLRIKELERENRELRQANEILRKASAYFAVAELNRPFRK